MSRKRNAVSYGDQLTGGTRDVNPQFLSGTIATAVANTAVELTLGTPIVRVGSDNSGHATIMEVLKIFVDLPTVDTEAAAAAPHGSTFSISTTSSGATPAVVTLDNPRGLAFAQHVVRNAFTAAGTGMLDIVNDTYEIDLTDGAGHGVLVATDNLFIQFTTVGFAAVNRANFKILYRFKKVSLVEYIGIVQSQQ